MFLGDFKLTESMAIVRHFGRKANLYGDTQEQAAHVDMIVDIGQDIKMGVVQMLFNPEFVSDIKKCYVTWYMIAFPDIGKEDR